MSTPEIPCGRDVAIAVETRITEEHYAAAAELASLLAKDYMRQAESTSTATISIRIADLPMSEKTTSLCTTSAVHERVEVLLNLNCWRVKFNKSSRTADLTPQREITVI